MEKGLRSTTGLWAVRRALKFINWAAKSDRKAPNARGGPHRNGRSDSGGPRQGHRRPRAPLTRRGCGPPVRGYAGAPPTPPSRGSSKAPAACGRLLKGSPQTISATSSGLTRAIDYWAKRRLPGRRQRVFAPGIEAARPRPQSGLGLYVDGPRLTRIGSGSMLGSLALICPAYFRVLRPLAKMGFADSELQTRERHLLPVNRAECLT